MDPLVGCSVPRERALRESNVDCGPFDDRTRPCGNICSRVVIRNTLCTPRRGEKKGIRYFLHFINGLISADAHSSARVSRINRGNAIARRDAFLRGKNARFEIRARARVFSSCTYFSRILRAISLLVRNVDPRATNFFIVYRRRRDHRLPSPLPTVLQFPDGAARPLYLRIPDFWDIISPRDLTSWSGSSSPSLFLATYFLNEPEVYSAA